MKGEILIRMILTTVPLLLVAMIVSCTEPGPETAPSHTTKAVMQPAEFTISDLVISPTEVEVSQEVTVTVKVKNIGVYLATG